MKFSIIIPIKNSEETLQWCLQSVMLQAGEDDYEVICVDNGSSDGSVGIVERFRDKYPKKIKLLHSSASTVSGVRNAGAKESKGEFFAFLDSDCIAPAWWLKKAKEFIKKGRLVFGGEYLPDKEEGLYGVWSKWFKINKECVVDWVPAGNFFIEREIFINVSGFDSNQITSEDVDICYRLSNSGFDILYSPELDVVHLGEPKNLWNFFKKEVWRGKGVLRLFLKTKGKVGGKPLLLALYSIMYLIGGFVYIAYGIRSLEVWIIFGFIPFWLLGWVKTKGIFSGIRLGFMYFLYGLARGLAWVNFG